MCKNEFKSQMKDASVGVLLVFQILETLMTVIDFAAVTSAAQAEADKLFSVSSSTDTLEEWCTSMVNTSAVCIAEKRDRIPVLGGGTLSAGILSANVSMWWVAGLVLATSWWLSLKNHKKN